MANLYDKAGLVNIPVGYQDGFLYNIKPEDNTLGFRFNRDSAATRVNKEGLIEQVGYFGPELVQNGDFSELGSELIPDGNFTNQAAVDYWQIADTGGVERATKSLENGFMRLTYDIANGSALYKSGIVTSGKSYKVTFRAKGTANSNFNSIGDNVNIPSNPQYVVSNPTLTDDWQDYEFYVPVSSTTLRLYLTSAQIGDTLDITNISVKQVDPNDYWYASDPWSITNQGAFYDDTSGNRLDQSNLNLVQNKLYKLTFDIENTTGTEAYIWIGNSGGTVPYVGTWYQSYSTGSNTVYFTMPSNQTALAFYGSQTGGLFYINNISLVEVKGDKPRIDYTDSLTSPSFLLEPQSTNLVEFSEDFTQWGIAGSGVQTSTVTNQKNPSGNNQSGFITFSSSVSGIKLVFIFTSSSSSVHSYSVFVKYHSKQWIQLNTSLTHANFDVRNGVLGSFNGCVPSIENYGNGWYKLSMVTNNAVNPITCILANIDDGTAGSTAASTSTGSYYVWGAQLEASPYPTSYIPTAGSTVTRAQETCNGAGSASTFNDSEGVLYAEIAALADDSTNRHITLSDGSNNNRLVLKYDNQSNVIQAFNRVGGVETAFLSASVTDITLFSKCAVKYKVNDYALWIDGVEVATDTNATTFPSSTLNDLKFGESGANSNFYGRTKGIYVFNEALTDDELQQLTGPEYNSFAALAAAYNYTVI